jgi:hypothetical protein
VHEKINRNVSKKNPQEKEILADFLNRICSLNNPQKTKKSTANQKQDDETGCDVGPLWCAGECHLPPQSYHASVPPRDHERI